MFKMTTAHNHPRVRAHLASRGVELHQVMTPRHDEPDNVFFRAGHGPDTPDPQPVGRIPHAKLRTASKEHGNDPETLAAATISIIDVHLHA